MDRLIASLDMRLELGVDLYGPALVGLLLIDDELVVLVEQLLPSEGEKVADAEPEEDSISDQETECILRLTVEFTDKNCRGVEIQIVRGLVPRGLLFLHDAWGL